MTGLLSNAGRSFLRAFVGSIVVLAPGVLAAPNLNGALTLATAAVIASVTAGIKAIQVFVPQLSIAHWVPSAYANIADSALRAFVGASVALLPGVLAAPDLGTAKALITALVIAAVTAAIRAVQGFLTPGDVPAPATGADVPDRGPAVYTTDA